MPILNSCMNTMWHENSYMNSYMNSEVPNPSWPYEFNMNSWYFALIRMVIHKNSPNLYGQEGLVTYEFIYEFIIFFEFIYEFNDFYEFIYECMYEFKYFWIQKYMNSWNSWIHGLWIHMFSEFINYVLWIRCVIQSCYLLRWDAAAVPEELLVAADPSTLVPPRSHLPQHQMAYLEAPLWLCPFESGGTSGCSCNE
jgi:hypothetical protein